MVILACGSSSDQTNQSGIASEVQESPPNMPGIVEVTAVGLTLEAKNQISSGWTTFRFKNASEMIHFTFLYRVPDSVDLAEHKKVAAVFQNFMDNFNGRSLSEPAAGMELPAWFSGTVPTGGPGLVSAGITSETTVFLTPGTYIMECYVKTDGIFHSYNSSPTQPGMVHLFKVTDEDNQATEPVPSLALTVSSANGITMDSEISAGDHVVAISFPDQKVHENFVQQDVHLIKLSDDSDLEEIVAWMDWRQPSGLQTPAPAGKFLGGINELASGETGYFRATLEPGNYVWISEVPDADEKGLMLEFTVSESIP